MERTTFLITHTLWALIKNYYISTSILPRYNLLFFEEVIIFSLNYYLNPTIIGI